MATKHTRSEAHFDGSKVEADLSLELQPLVANIVVKTTFSGFGTTSWSMSKDGSLKNLRISSSLVYGGAQSVSFSHRNILKDA